MAASNMNMRHESQVAVEEYDAARVNPEMNDTQALALAHAAVNLFRRWQLDDAEACAVLGGMTKPEWARRKLACTLGDFEPNSAAADAIVAWAGLHAESETGQVPYHRWSEPIKGHFVTRHPSLPGE